MKTGIYKDYRKLENLEVLGGQRFPKSINYLKPLFCKSCKGCIDSREYSF